MNINRKKLNGYIQARKEWISENDNYNISHFGISKNEYYEIDKKIKEIYGIFFNPTKIKISELNKY